MPWSCLFVHVMAPGITFSFNVASLFYIVTFELIIYEFWFTLVKEGEKEQMVSILCNSSTIFQLEEKQFKNLVHFSINKCDL